MLHSVGLVNMFPASFKTPVRNHEAKKWCMARYGKKLGPRFSKQGHLEVKCHSQSWIKRIETHWMQLLLKCEVNYRLTDFLFLNDHTKNSKTRSLLLPLNLILPDYQTHFPSVKFWIFNSFEGEWNCNVSKIQVCLFIQPIYMFIVYFSNNKSLALTEITKFR